jgi:TRAP-type mannitol/chloroaromatic compound transport system substrate-binding protein
MERRSFLRKAGVGAAASTALATPAIYGQANIRWRLPSSFPKSLDTIYGAGDVFTKKVSELTGGKFQISIHAAGEIVPAFGVLDAVQNGTVEACHTAPYYFFGKDETFALGTAIPFGLNSRQMTAWMFDGNGAKLLDEFYKGYNVKAFSCGNTGTQMGGWSRKEIKNLADMKGLKFRIGGFGGKVMEKIGAVPQNIPGGDVYPALEKGTIDAAEWVGPYDDEKLGFNKVAKFYYYPGWWEGGAELQVYVNTKAFEALPADFKAAIECAAAYGHVEMQARYDARNPAALKRLVAGGAQLKLVPRDVMDAAFKAANTLYDEISAKNANWKKIYDDYRRFRGDTVAWFRFAEAGFDQFMSRALR